MIDRKAPIYSDEHRPAPFHRKNTKRWCKGKSGVEHEYAEVIYDTWYNKYISYITECQGCGKRIWSSWRTEKIK